MHVYQIIALSRGSSKLPEIQRRSQRLRRAGVSGIKTGSTPKDITFVWHKIQRKTIADVLAFSTLIAQNYRQARKPVNSAKVSKCRKPAW